MCCHYVRVFVCVCVAEWECKNCVTPLFACITYQRQRQAADVVATATAAFIVVVVGTAGAAFVVVFAASAAVVVTVIISSFCCHVHKSVALSPFLLMFACVCVASCCTLSTFAWTFPLPFVLQSAHTHTHVCVFSCFEYSLFVLVFFDNICTPWPAGAKGL